MSVVADGDIQALLATDRPSYEGGWVDGYRAAYATAWDIGYGHALHVCDEQWRLAATPIVELCRSVPRFAELERYRNQPHGPVYEAARRARGGRDYMGGPVAPW